MSEPEVAVVYSPRDWVEKLDRFVVDHGGARVRAKVVDRRDAVEERYDVLVVDDTTAFLSRRFVEDLHRMGRRVLGVFDPREYATSDQLTAGMERLRQSGVDDVIEAVAAPLDFVAAIEALAVTSDDRLERELAQLGGHPIPPEPTEPVERPPRGFVTVVAGASGGCGATEVAVGLAGAVARRAESAVLVDADDVSPSVAQRL